MVGFAPRAERPKVVAEQAVFEGLCLGVGGTPTNTADPDLPGLTNIPGFVGTASTLARFILDIREVFGPYDTQMLAHIVRSRPALHIDRGSHSISHEMLRVYYFPGLELY